MKDTNKKKKDTLTVYIESELLDTWRKLVNSEGKFYSSAVEEAMKLYIEKYAKKQ